MPPALLGETAIRSGGKADDPSVEQSAQTLFELTSDLVQADLGVVTLNGESIEQFAHLLPANVALGVRSCLAKCGIPVQTPNQGNQSDSESEVGPMSAAAAHGW